MNELTPEELRELVGILDEQLTSLQNQVREYFASKDDRWSTSPERVKRYSDAENALRGSVK